MSGWRITVVALLTVASPGAWAQAPGAATTAPPIQLRMVANGFRAPTGVAAPHDGSRRLFVTEQGGVIRIVRNGTVLPTPFLDLSGKVSVSGERGLLGLAFDPDFASSRRFFVYYTMLPDDGSGGSIRISSFLASASNPDFADPASEREIITIPHPVNNNHNGGQLAFGPDGFLYAGTGDGGGGGDVPNNAQTLTVLLGKMLRLDVNGPAGYAIPAGNPAYAGVPGARHEAWAYGLRNPWRFGFDRATGDLYIGDVGQGNTEEVDYVPAGTPGGLDFGWHVFEGTDCYTPPCTLAGHTPPVLQYHHDAVGGIAIVGGYVYRGTRNPALAGYYLYGDFQSTRVWAAKREGSTWRSVVALERPNALASISAFGEDEAGEIHVVDYAAGRLFALDAPPSAPVNVALAAHGAVATASSTFGPGYPASGAIDGDAAGIRWTVGGGWADGTKDQYPDWLEVDFNGMQTIDRVVVYTLQDDPQNPSQPTDTMTFSQKGIVDFTVRGWDGSQWVLLASATDNDRVKRTVAFTPFTTARIRINVTRALGIVSRITEVEAWSVPPTTPQPRNVALASSGATALASSTFGMGYEASGAIDGDAAGIHWTAGGGWADGTKDQYPDWLEVDFNGVQTIDRVVVYTLQDDPQDPSQPTDTMTFSQKGIVDFTVQGWDGSQWVVLGTVTDNNRVKRTVTFTPFATARIRINVTRALAIVSRITEVEAWSVPQPQNVALASVGATAIASSTFGVGYEPSGAIDGDTAGTYWTAGGGWADGTRDQYPDWLEVDFNGTKTIDHVVVYTVQDNPQDPSQPTDTMTFSQKGILDFTVQGWDGSQWVILGSVTDNNRVKRTVAFTPFTTARIRIDVTRALAIVSRITEVEAWSVPSTTPQPSTAVEAVAAR